MPRMKRRKQRDSETDSTKRDPFLFVARAAQATFDRYRQAVAHFENSGLPDNLRKKIEEELANLLESEVKRLCSELRRNVSDPEGRPPIHIALGSDLIRQAAYEAAGSAQSDGSDSR